MRRTCVLNDTIAVDHRVRWGRMSARPVRRMLWIFSRGVTITIIMTIIMTTIIVCSMDTVVTNPVEDDRDDGSSVAFEMIRHTFIRFMGCGVAIQNHAKVCVR